MASASAISLPDSAPAIQTKADVVLFEQHEIGTSRFIRSMFTHLDPDDYAWVGENTERGKRELSVQDLITGLRKCPDEEAFPALPPDITIAPDMDPRTCFIKRPQLYHLLDEDVAPLVPRMLVDEAHTLEILKKNPHPNIVPYHGCVAKRGRITGIVLERYHSILDHRFLRDASAFDVEAFEQGLKAALQHIHSLGLAHNDINPSNIALDDNDHLVVID